MSRLVVALLVFLAIFVGFGLAAVGVPSEVAVASGFIVTGVALLVMTRLPSPSLQGLMQRLPVHGGIVGVAFALVGALLFAAGLSA